VVVTAHAVQAGTTIQTSTGLEGGNGSPLAIRLGTPTSATTWARSDIDRRLPHAVPATPTATPPLGQFCLYCASPGDCDGCDGVGINEIITLISIALGDADPSACPKGIPAGAQVTIALILRAVNTALNGCPGLPPELIECLVSGGGVSRALCCNSAADFPDTCVVGACGCPPADSHEVSTCECGPGRCFDRTRGACVARDAPNSAWRGRSPTHDPSPPQ